MNPPRLVAFCLAMVASLTAAPKEFFVYFGTYTNAKTESKGIYRSRLNVATGQLSAAELAAPAKDPAFLALQPNGQFLYAIDESADVKRTPGKGLSAYALNASTGALTFLAETSTGSSGACHLAVDATGRAVLIANYGGGGISAVALNADGRFGALGPVINHSGSSVNRARQEAPHAHGIYPSPDNRYVLVPDLGIDRIATYKLDLDPTRFLPLAAANKLPPGSGPSPSHFSSQRPHRPTSSSELLCHDDRIPLRSRHRRPQLLSDDLHPPSRRIDPERHQHRRGPSPPQRPLPLRFQPRCQHARRLLHRRKIRPTHLRRKRLHPRQNPRHFALDPTGTWLLAENQDSGTVAVFRVDPKSGRLTPTGQLLPIPSPVCAVFVPAP